MIDMSRLQADVDRCLAFLVANQSEWEPTIHITHPTREIPVTLIAVVGGGGEWESA